MSDERQTQLSAVVVAEAGCNHMGDLEIAKEMISTAKVFCKATHIKFQKRNPRECLSPREYDAPHPNPQNAFGRTYGEHRERLEFTLDQHRKLKAFCESLGMSYSSSVWDLSSAQAIASLDPRWIKIPSARNVDAEILGYLCDHYGGEIHVSLGMTTREEEEEIMTLLSSRGRAKDSVLYACTSGYPVPDESVCLLEIERLRRAYGGSIKAVGFSGHHLGIAIDIAAFALGARWIERHYTLDRTWKGTDHAASLEPDGLRRLVRDIAAVGRAYDHKGSEILEIEEPQRRKLKSGVRRSSVAA